MDVLPCPLRYNPHSLRELRCRARYPITRSSMTAKQSPSSGGIEIRKADHIRINLDEDVGFDRLMVGFENYRFIHQALPELDLNTVDLTTRLFHKPLQAPVLISSMT